MTGRGPGPAAYDGRRTRASTSARAVLMATAATGAFLLIASLAANGAPWWAIASLSTAVVFLMLPPPSAVPDDLADSG